ncbi:MAG: TRAP transporter large permease subunit [Paracoccaceae bacterium]|nr:TRAP transporter large permease subunit [Paracoccaceae bacterium]MDE2760132.1 TRAP transporter large permease subunit [Paracoccaceae bacterium]MDE2916417.1 TRAP transporter large permease subunit [Paracoccaceae bacterium]
MGKSDEIVGNPLVFQGGGNGSGQHGKPDDTFAKLGQLIHALLEPIARYLCYAAAIVTLLMSIFMVVDLFSRLVFNNPLSGMIELQTFMLVFMAFFSIAYTMLKNQHVAVDLITSVLSAPVNSFLQSVFSIWGIFLFGSMSWLSTTRALEAFENEEFSDIIQMPYWVLYSFAAIGTLLLTVAILALLLTHLSGLYQYHRNRTKLALIIAAIAVIGIAGIYSAELLKLLFGDLSSTTVGILYTLFLMIILMLGFPVGFAMAFTGLTGLMFLIGQDVAFNVSKINTYDAVAHYFFTVIPFFLLMGFLILHAGIGAKLYNAGIKVFGRLPGGLAIGTVAGCGGFAAICGESVAAAATMGSVSLPEMKKYNYDDSLATGSVAAGGTLGILIPPSIGFVVYGIITEQSIGKMFMAGIIPGIILTTGFCLAVYVQCILNPKLGPKSKRFTLQQIARSIFDIWPVAALFAAVIGGIYSGILTPTEAGGVGASGALLIALFSKGFNRQKLFNALLEATTTSAMIFTILIGVGLLGYFVTLTDIPREFANFLGSLDVSRYVIFILILLLYLVLGMVMNIIPMMMLTLPILFPTVVGLGFDPIWFGVIMVIMMEMGQITPPIGINVFVIHGVAKKYDVRMATIYRGIIPFVIVEVLVIILLTIFPEITLWLPNSMDVLAPLE